MEFLLFFSLGLIGILAIWLTMGSIWYLLSKKTTERVCRFFEIKKSRLLDPSLETNEFSQYLPAAIASAAAILNQENSSTFDKILLWPHFASEIDTLKIIAERMIGWVGDPAVDALANRLSAAGFKRSDEGTIIVDHFKDGFFVRRISPDIVSILWVTKQHSEALSNRQFKALSSVITSWGRREDVILSKALEPHLGELEVITMYAPYHFGPYLSPRNFIVGSAYPALTDLWLSIKSGEMKALIHEKWASGSSWGEIKRARALSNAYLYLSGFLK
jgi:hypothetical protein